MERERPFSSPRQEQTPAVGKQRIESGPGSPLNRLRGGVRAKVLAAGLAIGGSALAYAKAEAATMRPAEVISGLDTNEITYDEVGFVWEGGQLRVANLDDNSKRDIHWIGFRSMDDTEADASLPLPGHTPVPDRIIGPNSIPGDGIKSHDYILDGRLQVREDFFLAVGLDENGDTTPSLEQYLQGSRVYVGFSPIVGDPQNIDEAINLTEGVVYEGQVPNHLEPLVGYIIRPSSATTPEPSSLVLGGMAAAGLAVGARRRRRRTKEI